MLNFEFLIAWRFLMSTRLQTLLIVTGIIIGVGVQVFLASLIGGLQANLIAQTVGDSPHIYLSSLDNRGASVYQNSPDALVLSREIFAAKQSDIANWQQLYNRLKNAKDLLAVSPLVSGSGYIIKSDTTKPVVLRGILLDDADKIYQIRSRLIQGQASLGGNNVLIGTDLANDYRLAPGDVFQLTMADGQNASMIVSGIFDFANQSINSSWLFLDLNRAQTLLGRGGDISEVEIQIADVFAAEEVAAALSRSFPEATFETWQDKNASLVNGLKSQSSSSTVIQAFVLLSITLGIASVLAVSAFQRSKQIGILKAMGARKQSLSRIFFLQGALLGLVGSIIGSALGIGLVKAFLYFTSLSTGVPLFPILIDMTTIIVSVAIATVASTLAAIVPARRAASLSPIEVIRNG